MERVRSLADAPGDPHFRARGVFGRTVSLAGRDLPALPLPLDRVFLAAGDAVAPRLGETAEAARPW